MIQQLHDPVSVILKHDHTTRTTRPTAIEWAGRTYPILKLGLHHTYRRGAVRHHVFSVIARGLFFRLNLNTDSLNWTLEEVSDGLPD